VVVEKSLPPTFKSTTDVDMLSVILAPLTRSVSADVFFVVERVGSFSRRAYRAQHGYVSARPRAGASKGPRPIATSANIQHHHNLCTADHYFFQIKT
jgi:hypothetical protein